MLDFVQGRFRLLLYGIGSLLLFAGLAALSGSKPRPSAIYVPDKPLLVFHVVGENSTDASKAVYRTWIESFVAAGAPEDHPGVLWKWIEVESGIFFDEMLEEGLPAGSVVVVDNAMLFKSEEDAMDTSEIALHPLLRALRPWALMNHSEPLVVFLHNDGQCDAPWLNNTHHLLYRDTWCSSYHQEWLASQKAERERGPQSGWLRSIPFGIGFDGGRLDRLSAERLPVGQRSILFHYRGTQAYRKPSRELLHIAAQRQLEELTELAERALGHVTQHASGVGRVVLELTRGPFPLDGPTASERAIPHLELMRHSAFTLCPPGDQWEDYRIYEAIEAGSIPVIVRNATYKRCDSPHTHLEQTVGNLTLGGAQTPGVVVIDSWDELSQALAAATADPAELAARQQAMMAWWATQKRRLFTGLHGAVRLMRTGRWRERTTCRYEPLHWSHVAKQHEDLAIYWRRPQPRIDNEWNATAFWAYLTGMCIPRHDGWCEDVHAGVEHTHPMGYQGNEDLGGIGRCFIGYGCWCESETEDWRERCLTPGCGMDLAESFQCEAAAGGESTEAAAVTAEPEAERPAE